VRGEFPPDWNRSVITGVKIDGQPPHWTRIERFTREGGDIKGFWEAARFDGLLILALGWLGTGRDEFRVGIERWLGAFCEAHPANAGAQWNCGQETSLRLLHVLTAGDLLERWGGVRASPALVEFTAQHCARVAATLGYAVGQDNNHGTSEAAALFVGGAFLAAQGRADAGAARRWSADGRARLEERVLRLVMPDGSFAQHSTNYHRLLLDTLSLVEHFRRRFQLPGFSSRYRDRCALAAEWLAVMCDPATGGVPNLGANDGARILALHRLPYPDFRPTLHLACSLLGGPSVEVPPTARETARWLAAPAADDEQVAPGADQPAAPVSRAPRLFADGGYATLAAGRAWLLLRLPVYRFRPSQADPLHLDLWSDGENLLRDGGTFSYATDASTYQYFSGVASHNTVQFDDREPMPRISRFLYGAWPRCALLEFDAADARVRAAYVDHARARHERTVRILGSVVVVQDRVAGFAHKAVLRWRLRGQPGDWRRDGQAWTDGTVRIELESSSGFKRLEMATGYESRYYGGREPLAVIEGEVSTAGEIVTRIVGVT
jgi:hypothetical protein